MENCDTQVFAGIGESRARQSGRFSACGRQICALNRRAN